MNPYSLYIHIPFCAQKCAYCDFLSFATDSTTKQDYVESLCYEIQAYSVGLKAPIQTVFIGGGTPSVLTVDQLQQLFATIQQYITLQNDAEISIEVNPGTVTEELANWIQQSPINRVSIGLQSTHNSHLKALGRIHTYEEFLDTYVRLRKAGIENINIDVMFGLSNQTIEEWRRTLFDVGQLEPEHISAYGLIIEEDTPFYEKYEKGLFNLPSEEIERDMYHLTRQVLEEKGYHRYEISNFAKEGFECQHNLTYWTDKNYIGIGLGAASYINGTRYSNTSDMAKYLERSSHIDEIRCLTDPPSKKRRMEERIFLGLRLDQGIHLETFNKNFDYPFDGQWKEVLEKMIGEGLLVIDKGYLKLTERGIDVSNYVFTAFL